MRDLICGVDYSLSHTKLRHGHKVQLTSAFFACISLNSQAMKSTRIVYMILVIHVKFLDPTFSIFSGFRSRFYHLHLFNPYRSFKHNDW